MNKPVYTSKHRMTPLVATKIIRLGDSPIGINHYTTLAAGETDCRTKEAMPMRPEDSAPANRRPLAALCMMLTVLSVFVGLAAILGPGRAVYWVGTYLIPRVMILGVFCRNVHPLRTTGCKGLRNNLRRALQASLG